MPPTATACVFEDAQKQNEAWQTVPEEQKTLVINYADCVNSKFPMAGFANVSKELIALELQKGTLNLEGINTTLQSLGCRSPNQPETAQPAAGGTQ